MTVCISLKKAIKVVSEEVVAKLGDEGLSQESMPVDLPLIVFTVGANRHTLDHLFVGTILYMSPLDKTIYWLICMLFLLVWQFTNDLVFNG